MTAIKSRLPYALRVGVTGHRDLKQADEVERAVRRLLSDIAGTLSEPSVPLSWTIISPLARGADRLVARLVLEECKGRLEVITPRAVEDYRSDFASSRDREEFDGLYAQAASRRAAPGVRNTEREPDADREREAEYRRAGELVVDTSEILIAIWDGHRRRGEGGTEAIVRYAVETERVVVLWIDADQPQAAPRRIRALSDVTLEADPVVTSEPIPEKAGDLSRGYVEQVAYCTSEVVDRETYGTALQNRKTFLADHAGAAGLAMDAWAPLDPIVEEYVRADRLAMYYRKRHTAVSDGILRLAAAGVTVAVAQMLFFEPYPEIILAEVLAMLAVLGLWLSSQSAAWHLKWLHARFLAERLRAAYFTILTGTPTSDEAVNDEPLRFYRGPQHWLTRVVDSVTPPAARMPVPSFESLKTFLTTAWIEEQRGFHRENADRNGRIAKGRHVLGICFFATTLLMAILHFLHVGHDSMAGHIISFLALVLPVWGATLHALTSQQERERIAERSARMDRELGQIRLDMLRARTPDELRISAEEAAMLMKVETREWWVLLSFQEPRLHA